MQKYGLTMVAGLAALAIASAASAQTNVIRLTGSTAFRKATQIAIGNILNSGYVYGYSGTTLSSANQSEFRGTTKVGSFPVDIKCSWAGSVGGVATIADNLQLANCLNATNLTVGGTPNETGPYDSGVLGDVTMSDSFQNSTAYTSPTLVDTTVGVVPFVWCRNNGSPSSISNMTALLAQAMLAAGAIPMSQFTSNPGDANTFVYAVGRDADSGTRLDTFAESGFGIFSQPYQSFIWIDSNNTVTNMTAFPTNTIDGVFYGPGNSGYSSGGSVATALIASNSINAIQQDFGQGGWLIGYVGISDGATATNGGAAWMTYNGVPYSTNAVAQGQYSFWSYEHMMYRSSLSGTPKTIADQIATQIRTADATQSGILLPSMQVSRKVEGGVVTHN